MTRNTRTILYISFVAVAASLATSLAIWIRPEPGATSSLWLLPTLVALIALAGRFPFKLSPQSDATLFTVPLVMAVILLPPIGAVSVGALGCFISERLLKAPAKVLVFNVSNAALSAALAGIVFSLLTPGSESLALTPSLALAALAAGLTLHVTNLFLLMGMVTLLKGVAYWKAWKDAWKVDAVQEGALIALGLIGALVTSQAGWGLTLLLAPFVLGYYGFKRSVEEAVEKSRLAEELQQNLKELKETQAHLIQSAKLASVGTLAAGVAHEINNPVFAVTGRAEIFLRMLRNANDEYLHSEKALRDMDIILKEGVRIASIVKHLLDYARNSEEIKAVRLDLAMDQALELLAGKIARKGVRIFKDYQQSPAINGVSNRLEQVFMNLISNALDATPSSGVITLGCSASGDRAVAYVKDTGAGIPESIRDRIFEPFFTTKGVGNGTGLGMFICHKIVEEFEGSICFESAENVGTTVTVSFPLAEVESAEVESPVSLAAAG